MIGVPGPVPHTGSHLPELRRLLVDTYESASADTALATSWCFRRNLAEMRRVFARPGRRAPAIAALSEVSLARGWRRLGDTRPARAAIEPLLGTEFLEGPALAVFAAEGTGDAQLVARTRRRAAARLSRWAQRGVDQGYVDHVVLAYARQAHRLVPSSRARDLLRPRSADAGTGGSQPAGGAEPARPAPPFSSG